MKQRESVEILTSCEEPGAALLCLLWCHAGGGRVERANIAEESMRRYPFDKTRQMAPGLWIGCGTEDPGYNGVKGMDDLLTKMNLEGERESRLESIARRT